VEGVVHAPSSWQVVVGVGMLVYLKGIPRTHAQSGFSCRGGGLRYPAAAADAGTVPSPRGSSLSQGSKRNKSTHPLLQIAVQRVPGLRAHVAGKAPFNNVGSWPQFTAQPTGESTDIVINISACLIGPVFAWLAE